MILQKIIYRQSYTVDEGTQGFHDYVTKYESFEDFVMKVRAEANIIDLSSGFEIINISYPDKNTAVIVYKQLKLDDEETK